MSKGTDRILRAAVSVIRPHDGVFDLDIDEAVAASAREFLAYLPAPMRWGLPIGLYGIEYLAPLFGGGACRMSAMDRDSATRYLARFETGSGPLAATFQGLRALVLICFYQQPEVLQALGIEWQERAETLTRQRAELLARGL